MAKDKITDYSGTASSNSDVGGINLAEGVMVPSDLNNAFREIMSHLGDFAAGTTGVNVLNLQDDDNSASIKLQAPSAVTTTTTLTLPDGDGSTGQVIDTDGSGTLAWTKVQASNLDVSGNGTSGQFLASDGDGSFSWTTQASYPQVITVKTSGNYTIPSDANAVLIKVSGAGGGGGSNAVRDNNINNDNDAGSNGGDTTVSNTTLSISITCKGGKGGSGETRETSTPQTGSSGGDVITQGGNRGGQGHSGSDNSLSGTRSAEDGFDGDLVTKYVTGSNVGGEVLTISYGAGGTGGSSSNGVGTASGNTGSAASVEIWVW